MVDHSDRKRLEAYTVYLPKVALYNGSYIAAQAVTVGENRKSNSKTSQIFTGDSHISLLLAALNDASHCV